ncbi:hypothetical protein ACWDSF_06115 [Nocardia beijingensis]
MSTDLKAIMERHERHRHMLADPRLTGDLLLFAFALDEVIAYPAVRSRHRWFGESWVGAVEEMVCPPPDPRFPRELGWWVAKVVGGDIPRYEIPDDRNRKCVVLVPRRSGKTTPCGGTGVTGMVDRDPLTGEGRRVWACKGHQTTASHWRARIKQWEANGKPSPAPNAGGNLERYYSGDWDALYRWAKPWKEPLRAEREAVIPPPPRPTLRLIEGGLS